MTASAARASSANNLLDDVSPHGADVLQMLLLVFRASVVDASATGATTKGNAGGGFLQSCLQNPTDSALHRMKPLVKAWTTVLMTEGGGGNMFSCHRQARMDAGQQGDAGLLRFRRQFH